MLMLRGLDCCMVKGGASVRLLALETSPWSLCMACAGQAAHVLPGSCCAKWKGSWLALNLGHQTILVCDDQCCWLAGNDPRPMLVSRPFADRRRYAYRSRCGCRRTRGLLRDAGRVEERLGFWSAWTGGGGAELSFEAQQLLQRRLAQRQDNIATLS